MAVEVGDIRKLCKLRDEAEAADEVKKAAQKAHDAQQAIVWSQLEDTGQRTGKWEVGPPWGEVSLERKETIRARLVDRDVAIDSIESSGRSDEMVYTELRKKPLNDLVNDCIRQGIPLPEGLDFSSAKYVRISGR